MKHVVIENPIINSPFAKPKRRRPMKRREELYLVDIIEAAWKSAAFLEGVDQERFQSSDLDQSAVVFQLMVIGEASGKLAPEIRD